MWPENEYSLEDQQRLIYSERQPQMESTVAYHEIDMNNSNCGSRLCLTKQYYCLIATGMRCHARHIENEDV
jgi:hypothetical protein